MNQAATKSIIYWAVLMPGGVPMPDGISPNKTIALRGATGVKRMGFITPDETKFYKTSWKRMKRIGYTLGRVEISYPVTPTQP